MKRKLTRTLPGDKVFGTIDSMIRVDHAGEYGARRIYQGQLAVLGHDPKLKKMIGHMAAQEQVHLDFFEKEITTRQVRPTALHPLWHVAGYALGALTAKISADAAMACTVAVETAITEHYAEQLAALKNNASEKKLHDAIKKFKTEEEEHHATGIEYNTDGSDYPLLRKLIEKGTRLAIAVAKKV